MEYIHFCFYENKENFCIVVNINSNVDQFILLIYKVLITIKFEQCLHLIFKLIYSRKVFMDNLSLNLEVHLFGHI